MQKLVGSLNELDDNDDIDGGDDHRIGMFDTFMFIIMCLRKQWKYCWKFNP